MAQELFLLLVELTALLNASAAGEPHDGKVDHFLWNYFPTRHNELYRNGATGFTKELANAIPAEANQYVGPGWADHDGDG